jgi:hypothetical protein
LKITDVFFYVIYYEILAFHEGNQNISQYKAIDRRHIFLFGILILGTLFYHRTHFNQCSYFQISSGVYSIYYSRGGMKNLKRIMSNCQDMYEKIKSEMIGDCFVENRSVLNDEIFLSFLYC